MELAFLGLAGLQGRPAALKLGSGGLGSASQAADTPRGSEQVFIQLDLLNQPKVTCLQICMVCKQCYLHRSMASTAVIVVVQTTRGLAVVQMPTP